MTFGDRSACPREPCRASCSGLQSSSVLLLVVQKRLCARYRHLYHAGKAMCGHHRGGPRAGGIPLGDCLRGDGPAPCDARRELNDEPEFSTPCPPLRQCSRHAAPWTRRGELRRGPPRRSPPTERAKQVNGKCNGLDSGRGRPVRRRGHQKVCSYDYGKEASSLGSTLWGACPGSVSTPRRPPASSYFIVLGAIAPLRVTVPHRVCTRDGVAGARNC